MTEIVKIPETMGVDFGAYWGDIYALPLNKKMWILNTRGNKILFRSIEEFRKQLDEYQPQLQFTEEQRDEAICEATALLMRDKLCD